MADKRGAFVDLLAYIDSRKRVAKRNVSDLFTNPKDALTKTLHNAAETIPAYMNDPMNFVGGGIGKIVYHGSPHVFNRFNLKGIGTGEGNQTYGHGLYFADSPEVAKAYLGTARYDHDELINRAHWLKEELKNPRLSSQDATKIRAEIEGLRKLAATVPNTSSLYKVNLDDKAIDKMLDWDKLLDQQPDVLAAFKRAGYSVDKKLTAGEVITREIAAGNAKKVSADLLTNGIPGIKYLDGVSRGKGAGSSNYVVFDDQLLDIVERTEVK